jgi:hypothetical protein
VGHELHRMKDSGHSRLPSWGAGFDRSGPVSGQMSR